jgi:hypothetical protein
MNRTANMRGFSEQRRFIERRSDHHKKRALFNKRLHENPLIVAILLNAVQECISRFDFCQDSISPFQQIILSTKIQNVLKEFVVSCSIEAP